MSDVTDGTRPDVHKLAGIRLFHGIGDEALCSLAAGAGSVLLQAPHEQAVGLREFSALDEAIEAGRAAAENELADGGAHALHDALAL